jgi:hypothetical protein
MFFHVAPFFNSRQKMRPPMESRARSRFNLCGTCTVRVCSSSGQHRFLDSLRQRDPAEKHLWIEVIVTGYVDDPNETMLLRSRVAKRKVDLPLLKRRRVAAVVDARDQLF